MRFGFWTNNTDSWEDIRSACVHAGTTGWDGIWIADHFMPFMGDDGGPTHEAWTMLGALADAVPGIRLGTLVSGNTYRYPAVLAKMAATLDNISGGHAVLGLGAGWQENEHVAYGMDYSTVKGRLDRLDEAAELITMLLHNERSDFSGAHYRLENAPLSPRPVQARLPLLIGGGGEKRTLRTAARFADEWNVWGDPELLRHKNSVLDQHCADVGRDPSTIQRSAVALVFISDDEANLTSMRGVDLGRPTVLGTPAEVIDIMGQYRDAGVDEFIVPDFTMGPLAQRIDTMDLFINEVAPALR